MRKLSYFLALIAALLFGSDSFAAPNRAAPTSGTMSNFATDLNEELTELYQLAPMVLESVAGTNAITASVTPTLSSYAAPMRFTFEAANTNTGAVTLNINSVGAKAVVTYAGESLGAGILQAGNVYVVEYLGGGDDHFRLLQLIESDIWIKQDADYTLTSTTSAQKIFNESTNGRVTLGTGHYFFECNLHFSSMSATSGNGQFQVLGAGTATMTNVFYSVMGIDNSTPLVAGTTTQSFSQTSSSAASMVTATTGTGLTAVIRGTFNITVTGTVIPSIALVTAAAAVTEDGAYCRFKRGGATGVTTYGSWD